MKPWWSRMLAAFAWMVLAGAPGIALAQVQARVDRNPIDLGDTVVLSIQSTGAAAAPDLGPLMQDFELLDQSSGRSLEMVNGVSSSRVIHQITLQPRRDGNLVIPALQVGTQRTAPIALTVRPAPPTATRAGNADVFLETEVDDASPFVQQSVGVVLRLFYGVPLVSGELDLDAPDGAILQKVGDDVQGSQQINGRRYNLIERRYLLVPERSGSLTLPAPRFNGRGAGGWFDDLVGSGRRELRVAGTPRTLTVQPQPAGAPQPWLPLRDLRLRYVGAPTAARVGEAATLVVEGVAQGATQAQLPEMPAPSVPGAQVFAEPIQYDETFSGGTPQVKWTQRYAVVPDRPGRLTVAGLGIPWWDVATGTAKMARLPDLPLQVGAGVPASAAAAAPAGPASARTVTPAGPDEGVGSIGIWPWLAVAFAVLWLITLLWALQRRRAPVPASGHAAAGQVAGSTRHALPDLRRALDTGSLDEVGEVLRGMATPPAADLDELVLRLQAPAQRDAVEQLRRARWAGGDGGAARQALRAAFAEGPRWVEVAESPRAPLPPLYPSPERR
ncbi:BatD family protein [Pseudoxanthomonas beigongshangi]